LSIISRMPPYRAGLLPSPFLLPTQARTGSAPGPMFFPPRDLPVFPSHAASTSSVLHHYPRPLGFKCHFARLFQSHLQI
jgi:hypothetical protein